MEKKLVYNRFNILNWWTDDVWYIGCRVSPQSLISGQNADNYYNLLSPTYKYWFADPVPCKVGNQCYIFMEVYDRFRKKGYIGVSSIDNKKGTISNPKKIIEETCHMSFPYVFRYQNNLYMIPETHEMKQIRIYKMGRDIYEWNLYHAYDTKEELSDTIVLFKNQTLYFLNTEKNVRNPYQTRMHLFKVENLSHKSALIEIPLEKCSSLSPDSEGGGYSYCNRNGGIVIQNQEKIYRVIQESEDLWYGKDLVVREILSYGDEGYAESEDIIKLEAGSVPVRIRRKHKKLGIHTYGWTDGFEVVDMNIRQLSYVIFRQFVKRNINKLIKRKVSI